MREVEGTGFFRKATATLVPMLLLALMAGCSSENRAPAPRRASGQPQAAGTSARYSFGDGALPDGSEPFAGTWQTRAESGAPSPDGTLCQTATAEFPAIAIGSQVWKDLTATVRFKAVSGNDDQAAGIIARVIDADNYYILRANALEDNVNLYTYVDGKRSTIAEGTGAVAPGEWHELRLDVTGDTLTGYLDGKQVVTATNPDFTTGQVGLWTKADSQTCFDDLTITAH